MAICKSCNTAIPPYRIVGSKKIDQRNKRYCDDCGATRCGINWSKDKLEQAVSKNTTIAGVLEELGVGARYSNGNYKTFHKYVMRYNIDISHFNGKPRIEKNIGESLQKYEDSEIFIENSTYTPTHLKRRILNAKLLDYRCDDCGNEGFWNGKDLCLQIDHINGISNDHRLENLRFLCPNCHSQTDTYGNGNGKTNQKMKESINNCPDCGKKIFKISSKCNSCAKTRVKWPDTETLISLVEINGYSKTGRMFGTTCNAVRKRLRRMGIDTATVSKSKSLTCCNTEGKCSR